MEPGSWLKDVAESAHTIKIGDLNHTFESQGMLPPRLAN